MAKKYSRRKMLARTFQAAACGLMLPGCLPARKMRRPSLAGGEVIGEEFGAQAGERVLREGGNVVDAIVAAALVSCVAAPSRCGVGGYGGALTLALAGKKGVKCIDFNTMAPETARPDMYALDQKGQVIDRKNFFGWEAVGVPGTLAGLQLALDRFGTRSFSDLVQPAIALARSGVEVSPLFAKTMRSCAPRFATDPGSARLYLKGDGQPYGVGEVLRNPELADLLSTLARRNSVDSFYRGDVADTLAGAFRKHGGLVTTKDLANYRARETKPLRMEWNEFEVCTAPLTAGGLTTLEALSVLKALKWMDAGPAGRPRSQGPDGTATHARLEALRLAWKDRLELLGDPDWVKVPTEHLLSPSYAEALAQKVEAAVREKHPLSIPVPKHTDDGTVSLAAVDDHGNLAAMTLTQGGSFGSQVTAEGLGVTLGHGMSRFDPHPGQPNSVAPRKRPLHNMSPTVVLRNGAPVMALGGAGGVRIPNAIFDVLTQYLALGKDLKAAILAPRMHCTGTLEVSLESEWPKEEREYLKGLGFQMQTGPSAFVSAVSFDPETGNYAGVWR
jgi:gamma-glutamyltranspeptidase/glutathione hydrolase